jgi:hypothetical protein
MRNGSEIARRRSALFYMRLDPQLKQTAQRAAEADRRSLASLIEMLLPDYCREHGFLPERGGGAAAQATA